MSTSKLELQDLKAFSDPFSEATFQETGEGWTAEFDRRGRRIAIRRDKSGKIFKLGENQLVASSFKALLASRDFADLRYFAQSQAYALGGQLSPPLTLPFVISENSEKEVNFDEVNRFLLHECKGAVVGIEGPAGAGKTHFIERLARSRAQDLLHSGSDAPLVIPITSGGKILSAIDDRIDGSLNALRANFNRSEIPVLMRHGLVSIAIDGFDELSDSRGYSNSFSALRELLRELGKDGLVILSGRDSFLGKEILEDLIGATAKEHGKSLHTISVRYPAPADAAEWIVSKNEQWSDYQEDILRRLGEYSWLRRPFFVSQISLLSPTRFLSSENEPIISLCEAMIDREIDKIGLPADVDRASGGHIVSMILVEASRAMMDYEIDYVDPGLLELAVELACEQFAPGKEEFSQALKNRASTLTMLEPASETGDLKNRKFPHETIKSYFYAKHIIGEFSSGETIPLGLRRSQLTISDLSVFSSVLRTLASADVGVVRNRLLLFLGKESSSSNVGANLTALIIACLPEDEQDSSQSVTEISHRSAIDAMTSDRPIGTLKGVYINRLDARGSNLSNLNFKECEVFDLIVNSDTRFGRHLPDVATLYLEVNGGKGQRFRGAEEIQRELSRMSTKEDAAESEIPETLDVLARLMLRGHWVRLIRDDKRGRRLLDRPDWEDVKNILRKFDLLEENNIGAGGKPSEFIHLKKLDQFLSPATASDDVLQAIEEITMLGSS